MENTSNDLFSIQLNQEASTSIQKTFAVARWLVIGGLIVIAINLGIYIMAYFIYDQYFKVDDLTTIIRKYILPALNIAGLIMFLIQLILYFNFFRKARRAILINDNDLFNQAFRLLYKNSLYALAQFVLSTLVNIYYFYSYVLLLDRTPA